MILKDTVMAFVGTIAFSVLFDVPKKHYALCGLVGALGWISFKFIQYLGFSIVTSTVVASAVITFTSMILSMKQKTPTTIFLTSGIFCLVPGAYIYYASYNIFAADSSLVFYYLKETAKIALAISFGIILVYSFSSKIFSLKNKKGNTKIKE
ncbi:MAG: threonine/serine exporter family protein [Intestinibacter sp.]|uniref:threonine/serine exporter family protein n=1 Tax=Intestinibacter sp. TaxID=1965304 RepID=UPI003F186976